MIERDFSMPNVWLNILLNEKITDKADTLIKLKYEYTVNDVYDLLEFLDVQTTISKIIESKNQKVENNYANR